MMGAGAEPGPLEAPRSRAAAAPSLRSFGHGTSLGGLGSDQRGGAPAERLGLPEGSKSHHRERGPAHLPGPSQDRAPSSTRGTRHPEPQAGARRGGGAGALPLSVGEQMQRRARGSRRLSAGLPIAPAASVQLRDVVQSETGQEPRQPAKPMASVPMERMTREKDPTTLASQDGVHEWPELHWVKGGRGSMRENILEAVGTA